MKKLMILSLLFFAAACSQSAPKKDPNCKCTHTECPCPHNCSKCYCNDHIKL
ncbi:MAG: hypothetical protein H7A38_05520 [Chlamydiales bacterium]|nr:hypothetical protein [Chlamydiales bacterium]